MCRSSPFRSTLNTGYITALDKCKVWTPFRHICPYFHNLYTLLCLKDDFTFTFPRGLIWKFDNPSTTLSVAPAKFDNPYKGAESAGCLKQPQLPIYYQPFLGFYNYWNSIYNDGLQGPPCRISQFKGKWISDQVLTSGVKDDQWWTSPSKAVTLL